VPNTTKLPSTPTDQFDVAVIGAGPAGVVAALRAARVGARTALVTRDELGGMAANDGPVPVRTLAHAARLIREARQLSRYGIDAGEPSLDYRRLLARVREVTGEVREQALFRDELKRAGVSVYEHAGTAGFVDPRVIECENGPPLRAAKAIVCTGGASRRLPVPGFELTSTHSDAWQLTSVPDSMLVIGAGATGVQVASIFNAFGSRVTLFEAAPRILMSEDEQVSAAMSAALRTSGVRILEHAGKIERFEPSPAGVRLLYSEGGTQAHVDATLAVVAVGWVANTDGLDLATAGVETDPRGYIKVDSEFRTTAPGVYAAGDVTGHLMVVHEAAREAYLAATNATLGRTDALPAEVSPLGSFTDPEYASVGLSEATASESHDVVVGIERFDSLPRPIIDGRPTGFCKLIAERDDHAILGCHIVGERAVELAQLAAVAVASGMKVEELALVPFSFPTYANVLGRAAIRAARQLESRAGRPSEPMAWDAGVSAGLNDRG
jgi:pyruvate/2-oxoglutarate dehydrogenase complex dihydrolipoamide dehydrogenase (E3) component